MLEMTMTHTDRHPYASDGQIRIVIRFKSRILTLHEIRFDCWRFDFGPRDLGFDLQIFAIRFEVARFGN